MSPWEGTTRRGFLAGVGAGAAVQLLPGGLHAAESLAAGDAPCTPNAPGARALALAAAPGARTAWRTESAGRTITELDGGTLAEVRAIDVGAAPVALALSRDARRAAVVTAAYDHPALALVDLRAGRTTDRLDVGRLPAAVAIAADGRRAVVAGGGGEGTLTPVDLRTGRVGAPIALGGRQPRAVALAPDGRHAYVTLNGDAAVAVVALAARRVVQRFAVAPFPSRVAITPDGRAAHVTHDGAAERRVTTIDLVRRRVGTPHAVATDPCGVAIDRRGRVVAVAASGARTVALLDARTGRVLKRVPVPIRPRAVAATRHGFVAVDWRTGAPVRIPVPRRPR